MNARSFIMTMKILLGGSMISLLLSSVWPSLYYFRWAGLVIIFASPVVGSVDRAIAFGKRGDWRMMIVLAAIWIAFAVVGIYSFR